MTFLKDVNEALAEVIKWIAMIFTDFCEWINISEWAVLSITLIVIGSFASISIYRNRK